MRRQGAVFAEAGAADRLAELGLKPELLERALRGADAEARTYTPLDPPNMAGMARYARTVRLLREQLLPLGWSYDNPRNLARTISPDRRVAITTAYGDAATGCRDVVPSTRYEKGIATVEAVNRNFVQLTLPIDFGDGMPDDPADPDEGGTAAWMLLYHVAPDEIRAELSLPDSMVDGYIDTWIERILLEPIPFEEAPRVGSVRPAADPEVVVARRDSPPAVASPRPAARRDSPPAVASPRPAARRDSPPAVASPRPATPDAR